MIDIYFVRHGQTDGNIAKRHQAEHSKLTAEGKQQAAQVARWAKELVPTHLIASSHVRTLQTAQVIGDALETIPETSPLFIELMRPDTIYGHRHKSPRAMLYLIRWYLGLTGSDGSDGAGESYEAFRERLDAAQKYLKTLPDGSRVVVVSHAVFISLMVAHLCDKRPLPFPEAFKLFRTLLHLHNGSYTHVQYDPKALEGTCGWELISYDNHEHLRK